MPGRRVASREHQADDDLCSRCRENTASIQGRNGRQCSACFISYVQTKVLKSLASFAVKQGAPNASRKVLLPVSFGISSVTLLYIIDQHLERQRERTGRVGYELHVLHANDGTALDHGCTAADRLEALKTRFPRHTYYERELQSVHVSATETDSSSEPSLSSIIDALPTASSRADVLEISRQKTIAVAAKELGCDTVLYGHTTTRLAERLLAETAKGRGYALPWLSKDGSSSFEANSVYPLREMLKKEVLLFADVTTPPLTPLSLAQIPQKPSTSAKNMTIDSLMKDYFESVEQNYPSIVANVVKTSSRLDTPNTDPSSTCALCGTPLPAHANNAASWAGEQQAENDGGSMAPEQPLCYGCARTMSGIGPVSNS